MTPGWFTSNSHPQVNVMRQQPRFHPNVGHSQQRMGTVGVNPPVPSQHGSYPRSSPPMHGGHYPSSGRSAGNPNQSRGPPPQPRNHPPPRMPPGRYSQPMVVGSNVPRGMHNGSHLPPNAANVHSSHGALRHSAPSPAMPRRMLAPPNALRPIPQQGQSAGMASVHPRHEQMMHDPRVFQPVQGPHGPHGPHHGMYEGVGGSMMRMKEQRGIYHDVADPRHAPPGTPDSRISPSPPPVPPVSSAERSLRPSPTTLSETDSFAENIPMNGAHPARPPPRDANRQTVLQETANVPSPKASQTAEKISSQKSQQQPNFQQKGPDITMDAASMLLALRTSASPATVASTATDDKNQREEDSMSTAAASETHEIVHPQAQSSPQKDAPPQEFAVVPKNFPTRLSLPNDEAKLNSLHCFLRSELLEIFVVERSANKSPTHSPGSSVGRVGLRCVFCAQERKKTCTETRDEAPMAVFYPKSIAEIYRLVTSWQRCHLRKCRNLPPDIRSKWTCLRENDKSRGKTHYWITSAKEIGLVDCQSRAGGIRFSNATCTAAAAAAAAAVPTQVPTTSSSTSLQDIEEEHDVHDDEDDPRIVSSSSSSSSCVSHNDVANGVIYSV